MKYDYINDTKITIWPISLDSITLTLFTGTVQATYDQSVSGRLSRSQTSFGRTLSPARAKLRV